MANLSEKSDSSSVFKQLEEIIGENEMLRETYAEATSALLSLRAEDTNWIPLNGITEDEGFTLENIKDIGKKAELQAKGNPLLVNGLRLRTTNVFGRGVNFDPPAKAKDGFPPRFQKILDKPNNKSVLFSQQAFENNEQEAYIRGNLIMAYRKSTDTFFPIPLREITNAASNPDSKQDVWYYERTYTKIDLTGKPATNTTVEWYPVLEKFEDGPDKQYRKIDDNPVVLDVRIIDFKVNTSIGTVWGTPDCLPAMPYAWAHAEYIRDASKLLKALSTIAWKVVARSKANSSTAATKMASPKRSGSTATMTEGTDLIAMPKSGQVDMKDGQTIASYVAAALGVSLVSLLQDSGASGSYGAVTALDGPSANTARARQALWVSFYERCFRAIGVDGVRVNFPKISEDPAYRVMQTLQIGFAFGAFSQAEFRAAALEATDVHALSDKLPEPTPFTSAAQYSIEAQKQEAAKAEAASEAATAAAKAANVQGVGQSNGVAASVNNNDLRQMDNNANNQTQ